MTAVQTFVPGDIVVIGENDSGIRVGSSGEVIRLLDNGSVVVEVLPGKRYAVAPRHVSLKTSDRPERAVPPLWRIGDKVRCTHDVDDGPKAGTPGWAFGSHMVPGQVKVKFPEHGIMAVPSAELEPDPNQSSVSRARDAFRARLAEKRGHPATEVRAAATSVPKPEADPEGQEAPVKSLRNIWERQPAEETPLVETLAEVPQLLDEPPSGAPKKRKSRGR